MRAEYPEGGRCECCLLHIFLKQMGECRGKLSVEFHLIWYKSDRISKLEAVLNTGLRGLKGGGGGRGTGASEGVRRIEVASIYIGNVVKVQFSGIQGRFYVKIAVACLVCKVRCYDL